MHLMLISMFQHLCRLFHDILLGGNNLNMHQWCYLFDCKDFSIQFRNSFFTIQEVNVPDSFSIFGYMRRYHVFFYLVYWSKLFVQPQRLFLFSKVTLNRGWVYVIKFRNFIDNSSKHDIAPLIKEKVHFLYWSSRNVWRSIWCSKERAIRNNNFFLLKKLFLLNSYGFMKSLSYLVFSSYNELLLLENSNESTYWIRSFIWISLKE